MSNKSKVDPPVAADLQEEEEEEYEVEKILKVRVNPKTKRREFFVKWENWPIEDATWEPEANLDNVKDMIFEFDAKNATENTNTVKTINNAKSQKPSKQIIDDEDIVVDDEKDEDYNFEEDSEEIKPPKNAAAEKKNQKQKSQTNFQDFMAQNSKLTNSNNKKKGQSSKQNQEKPETAEEIQKETKTSLGFGNVNSVFLNQEEIEEDEEDEQGVEEEEMVFEKIENFRSAGNDKYDYLVRFQNQPEAMWVHEDDLEDFREEIKEFNAKRSKSQKLILSKPSKPTLDKTNGNGKQMVEQVQAPQQVQVQLQQQGESSKGSLEKGIRKTIEKVSLGKINQEVMNCLEVNSKSKKQSKVQSKSKNSKDSKIQQFKGDFMSDNVEKLILLGDSREFMSCRVEVTWKKRPDDSTPLSTVYSTSYLRREQPALLIDHLSGILKKLPCSYSF